MSARPNEVLWNAEPHTLAKIQIVARYVYAWATVLGRSRPQPLTYLDGFAGPGEYKNHPEGSPLAAIRALTKAKDDAGKDWKATVVQMIFIEADARRSYHLANLLDQEPQQKDFVRGEPICATFVEGLAQAGDKFGSAFATGAPLLAFVDPFGATGVPFNTIERILSSPTSELILNFDADGIARIFSAGASSNHEVHLDSIFGCSDWRSSMDSTMSQTVLSRKALELYTTRLRQLSNVRYVFAFEMAGTARSLDYFLIFASQSPVGLKKMKEVMRKIDQTGSFRFIDAAIGQHLLFRYDHPEDWLPKLLRNFAGRTVTIEEIEDFVLNETPFVAFKQEFLAPAERNGWIEVVGESSRRCATFPDGKVKSITFTGGADAKAEHN